MNNIIENFKIQYSKVKKNHNMTQHEWENDKLSNLEKERQEELQRQVDEIRKNECIDKLQNCQNCHRFNKEGRKFCNKCNIQIKREKKMFKRTNTPKVM